MAAVDVFCGAGEAEDVRMGRIVISMIIQHRREEWISLGCDSRYSYSQVILSHSQTVDKLMGGISFFMCAKANVILL
jgi:hypothetical protein